VNSRIEVRVGLWRKDCRDIEEGVRWWEGTEPGGDVRRRI